METRQHPELVSESWCMTQLTESPISHMFVFLFESSIKVVFRKNKQTKKNNQKKPPPPPQLCLASTILALKCLGFGLGGESCSVLKAALSTHVSSHALIHAFVGVVVNHWGCSSGNPIPGSLAVL